MNPVTPRFRKSTLTSAVLLALSINGAALTLREGTAEAAKSTCITSPYSTDSANFTMLTPAGNTMGPDGGTNDVLVNWDGTVYSDTSDYTGPGMAAGVANITMSSSDQFFGASWVAHDVQVFLPGSYSFDTTLGGGNGESGILNVTVGPGQLGMHMLFDWSGSNNIDVFIVVNPNSVFGPGIARSTTATVSAGNNCDNLGTANIVNCLFDGKPVGTDGKPLGSKVWMLASADGNSDGVMGIPMATGGPFPAFKANFNFPGTFTNTTGVCAGFVDTTPDPFPFTAVANAAFNTVYESNTITVSGLGVGQTPAVTIINGEYSKNGGAYTSVAGTATNGDTFKVRGTSPGADNQTTNVALTVGGGSSTFTIATPIIRGSQGSNFTMIDVPGGVTGGTNDVVATWDGTYDSGAGAVNSTNFSRMSISSVTPFFQYIWTAHHIRVFGPGTYTIDTTCTVAQLNAGTSTCNNPLQTNPVQSQQFYTFTVGAGQIGAHILFDWNNHTNIDVVEVWNQNAIFGPSAMHTGAGACNNPLQVWDLMSTDWDGDGNSGGDMVDGAFVGFSANFNLRLATSTNPQLTCSAYSPSVNVDDPSGTSGCSISTKPVNALQRGDWWLVAGFLVWLGALRLRFKRQIKVKA